MNLRFSDGVQKMKRSIAVCLGLLALASPAAADSPVAVVEDVQGKVTGAEFMDYVTPKAVIKIGDGGSVILSYLKSCRRETISGAGTVVVGTEESTVHLADVKAEKTNCDPNQANATTRETSGVAATVLRSVDSSKAPAAAAHPLRRLAAGGGQRTRQAGHSAPRRAGRTSGDQSRRHPAQGTLPRFRQRERRPGSRRRSTPQRSNHRGSSSG